MTFKVWRRLRPVPVMMTRNRRLPCQTRTGQARDMWRMSCQTPRQSFACFGLATACSMRAKTAAVMAT